jgi:hypothetical protein
MTDKLEMPIEQFAEAVSIENIENARLNKRIEKLEAALREIVGALNDPKGGQHVYDMRNASYIARKALENNK